LIVTSIPHHDNQNATAAFPHHRPTIGYPNQVNGKGSVGKIHRSIGYVVDTFIGVIHWYLGANYRSRVD
jgi:hypothetical protein